MGSEMCIRDRSYVDDVMAGDSVLAERDRIQAAISKLFAKISWLTHGWICMEKQYLGPPDSDEKFDANNLNQYPRIFGYRVVPGTMDAFVIEISLNLSKKRRGARSYRDLKPGDDVLDLLKKVEMSRRTALILCMQLWDPWGVIILIQNSARLLYRKAVLEMGRPQVGISHYLPHWCRNGRCS